MDKKLHILMLQNAVTDAELIERELRRINMAFILKHVDTKAGFLEELEKFKPDIILADYKLPSFEGLSALAIVKEKFPDMPFIFVSGTIGEELAIETLKRGATDYVLKERLSRLAPIVHRALNEREERVKRGKAEMKLRASEERYHTLFQRAVEGILVAEKATMKFIYANPAICGMLGYKEKELTLMGVDDIYPQSDLDRVKSEFAAQVQGKKILMPALPCLRKDGTIIYANVSAAQAVIDGKECNIGFFTDITEYRAAEERIKRMYEFQTVIREINQNLLRLKSEPELFQIVCDLLIKLRNIRFVWIGLVEKGSSKIKPVSHAGFEDGYLEVVKVIYNDSETDIVPMNRVVNINQSVVINDMENGTALSPLLKKEAMKRGYASNMILALVHGGEVIGSLCLYSGEKDVFGDEEVNFFEEVANDISVGIKFLRLEKKVEEGYKETKEALKGTIDTISLIGEFRDPYTAGHQRRVSQLACAISKKVGIAEEQIEGIRIAGLLHDIGKIAIPSDILNKPGRLSDSEYDIIKSHSNNGYKILKGIQFLGPVAKTVLQHHERINGSGYPSGISSNDIMIEAKILGVADIVEAMGSYRPYRPALGIGKALEEIHAKSGILYDAAVVDACLKVFREGFVFE